MKYNIVVILLFNSLCFLHGQSDSTKFKLLFVGLETAQGFDKANELVSFGGYSNGLLIKRAVTPKVGFLYKFMNKGLFVTDLHYSFYRSSIFETLSNTNVEDYYIRTEGVGVNLGLDYYFISKNHYNVGILSSVSLKSLKQKSIPSISKEVSYNKIGYKIGFNMYRMGANIRLFYSRLGESNMIGAELNIGLKTLK